MPLVQIDSMCLSLPHRHTHTRIIMNRTNTFNYNRCVLSLQPNETTRVHTIDLYCRQITAKKEKSAKAAAGRGRRYIEPKRHGAFFPHIT